MAYTLKSSGIATVCTALIAVDSDGTTIKEFVNATSLTINGGVSTSSATWKGTTRGYFATPTGVDAIVASSGPTMTFASPGVAFFAAFSGASSGTGAGGYMYMGFDSTRDRGFGRVSASSAGVWLFSGAARQTGATALPTDGTTKFSVGGNYVAGGQKTVYYGLESGSLASDSTATDADFPGDFIPNKYCALTGLGSAPGNYHCIAFFSRALTLAEMQSLHDDWFNTLFVSGGGDELMGTQCL